jgi:hypothetical protein
VESCNLKAMSSLLQQELNTSEPGRHLLEALLSLTKRGRIVEEDSLSFCQLILVWQTKNLVIFETFCNHLVLQDFEEDSQWCDPDENLAVCSANGNAITSLRDKATQVEVESEVRQLNIMLDSAVMSMASVLDLCKEYIIQSGFPDNIDQRAKNIQEKMEILETKSTETSLGSILLRFNILLNSWDVEENPGPSPFRSLFFHCN